MTKHAWIAVGFCVAVACGSDDAAPGGAPGDAGSDAGSDASAEAGDGAQPSCGTAAGALPDGLVELSSLAGEPTSNLRDEAFSITASGTDYALAERRLREAARFEIERPALIHGFAIQWAHLPTGGDPARELEAGLYRDFGHNGFDYWEPDPYFTGTRCVGDAAEGWVSYSLDTPLEVEQPGLVYVAHESSEGQAVFAFGEATADACDIFDDCHSGLNLPEVPGFFDGLSFPFQYPFAVRLYLEYISDAPSDPVFSEATADASGRHASWGDFDADGWDDLLVGGRVWHNDGGNFVDATDASGIAAMGLTITGGVWGDYDNDGCLDLFVFAESMQESDALLKNDCDGTFSDVTVSAQITDSQTYETCGDPANIRSPTAAAAWVDLDADGYLDLYLANFICWDSGNSYVDTVFHNLGDGTFEEWTAQNGFIDVHLPSRGVAPADYDADGDVDLFVNTYRLQPNLLFANQGGGSVAEEAAAAGAAGHPVQQGLYRWYGHTIGAAWGDLDNDADLDLVAANLAHPRFFDFSDRTQILLNEGSGTFSDVSGAWDLPYDNPSGLRYQETHSVPVLADFDNDGNLDLVITSVYDGRPTDFYWGNGDGTFRLDVYRAQITTENGWGAAAADYDNDGDVDLMATTLFQNRLTPSGHFLQVRVVGNVSANRAALGSSVRVEPAGTAPKLRHVQGGSGKGGQDSQTLHFGLGSATSVERIVVTFPGGNAVTYSGPFAVDQRVWLYEDGSATLGWVP